MLNELKIEIEKITEKELMNDGCSFTINKKSKASFKNMYMCEHSPIRTQIFQIKLYNIPTFVSVHLSRHKISVEHFIQSKRTDKIKNEKIADRNTLVNHMILLNAQALINMSRKRLCYKSSKETIYVMNKILDKIKEVDKYLYFVCVPECVYRCGCPEFNSCCYWDKFKENLSEEELSDIHKRYSQYKK